MEAQEKEWVMGNFHFWGSGLASQPRAGARAKFGVSRTPAFLCIKDIECSKKSHFKEKKGFES